VLDLVRSLRAVGHDARERRQARRDEAGGVQAAGSEGDAALPITQEAPATP